MANQDPKAIARRCLEAWTAGDFDTARGTLASEVEFIGPMGTARGADAYIEGVRGFKTMVERAEIRQAIGDGDHVCLLYDLITKVGAIPTAGWYRVKDGKIGFVRAFFDPRPFDRARNQEAP